MSSSVPEHSENQSAAVSDGKSGADSGTKYGEKL